MTAYLNRLRLRRDARALRDSVVFGLVAGWLLLLVGLFERFLVVGARALVWSAVAAAGALILALALAYPAAIRPLYALAHRIGSVISGVIFRAILAVLYAIMILPAGLWIRSRRGSHPFYAWDGAPPMDAEGWTAKTLPDVRPQEIARHRTSTIGEAASAINYFIAIRRYAYLPLLVALIVLGLILFLVQTSALAPFIYTLF